MTSKKSKNYLIAAIVAIVVVLVGVYLFNQPDTSNTNSTQTSNIQKQENSTLENFHPQTSITHAHGMAVDRGDSNRLHIATHEGLFVLIDDKNLYRIGESRDDFMGFFPHPSDPNTLFSSGHPRTGGNIGFQKSTDGGLTWKKLSNGVGGPVDFHAMTISPANPNLVYGWYHGNLQRSTNQGSTWEIVNRDLLTISLVADPIDENKLYASTPNGKGVLVSSDKGITFVSLSPQLDGGAVATLAIDPSDPQYMLVFAEALGGLGMSKDGGATWESIDESFGGEAVLHIAYDPMNTSTVYAMTQKNRLYKSIDRGSSWRMIR